ncbi:MAG: hypothetical protein JOZ17_00640, partial [Acetobacteraceae bacterium]|nr:hypothetical protein [Acetobacteraceae bacterium]
MEAHARPYEVKQPDGTCARLRVLTVMAVNRRAVRRSFADVTYAFQVCLQIRCESGLHPRCDLSGYGSADLDAALADLHYHDVAEYAVGRNTSATWKPDPDGVVRTARTDFLPPPKSSGSSPIRTCAMSSSGWSDWRHTHRLDRRSSAAYSPACRRSIRRG